MRVIGKNENIECIDWQIERNVEVFVTFDLSVSIVRAQDAFPQYGVCLIVHRVVSLKFSSNNVIAVLVYCSIYLTGWVWVGWLVSKPRRETQTYLPGISQAKRKRAVA